MARMSSRRAWAPASSSIWSFADFSGQRTRFLVQSRRMLVRRLADAPAEDWHQLRYHGLMDAGELGARNMSVTWLEIPVGAGQALRADGGAEQAYVIVRGAAPTS